MNQALTATKHFGFTKDWLAKGLAFVEKYGREPRNDEAGELGIGTIQVEATRAWMRFAGLAGGDGLTAVGRALLLHDPTVSDTGTWWTLHARLSRSYIAWHLLAVLPMRTFALDDLDHELRALAGQCSDHTILNARRSVISALFQTPVGTDLGLVRLVEEGRRVVALEKLQVRREAVPLPVFAYVVANWAKDCAGSSAPLERLAEPDAPGGIFHLSLGALERLLMEVEGAFGGTVLTYSRTAGLDEVYFHFQHSPLALLECYYRSRGAEKPCGEVLSEILTEGWEMEAE